MTMLSMALDGVRLTPVLAETDWVGIAQGGGTAGMILGLIYVINLVMKGTVRLEREILSETKLREAAEKRTFEAEARADAAEKRTFEAEARADAAEQRAGMISDEVRSSLTPEVLRLSGEAAKMVSAGAHNAEMMSQLIAALIPKAKP
jgi:hypothetical protein